VNLNSSLKSSSRDDPRRKTSPNGLPRHARRQRSHQSKAGSGLAKEVGSFVLRSGLLTLFTMAGNRQSRASLTTKRLICVNLERQISSASFTFISFTVRPGRKAQLSDNGRNRPQPDQSKRLREADMKKCRQSNQKVSSTTGRYIVLSDEDFESADRSTTRSTLPELRRPSWWSEIFYKRTSSSHRKVAKKRTAPAKA